MDVLRSVKKKTNLFAKVSCLLYNKINGVNNE